jgi:hypothetical protein
MDHYAGIDVSLEYSSICVVDAFGPDGRPQVIYRPATVYDMEGRGPLKGGGAAGPEPRLLLR